MTGKSDGTGLPTSWRKWINRRPSKYGNRKTTNSQGEIFDSKKEAAVIQDLRLLENAGEISHLAIKQPIPLMVGDTRIGTIVPEARYFCHRRKRTVAVDVKGFGRRRAGTRRFTTRTALFNWKWKHLQAQHPNWIYEII